MAAPMGPAVARFHSTPDLCPSRRSARARLNFALPPENELRKGLSAGPGAGGERTLSEHQLRVQRSLQRLHVPDWYKNNAIPQPGFLLRRSSADAHHWPGLASKTTSLSSLGGGAGGSSVGSATASPSPATPSAHLALGGGPTPAGHSPTGGWSGEDAGDGQSSGDRERAYLELMRCLASGRAGARAASLMSGRAGARVTSGACTGQPLLSPSPVPHTSSFSRWSTSRLCGGSATTSASTSPGGSARSSFNYRQPYLGWRSQERLARPRTPAERLAAGLLAEKAAAATTAAVAAHAAAQAHGGAHSPSAAQQQSPLTPGGSHPLPPLDLALAARDGVDETDYDQTPQVPNLSEVRTSIKEVTSAIVHYVSGVRDDGSSEALNPPRHDSSVSPRSTSPRGSGRLCWLESSFVGSRPLDSPETPLSLTSSDPTAKMGDLYLELNKSQGFSQLNGEPQLVM